MRTIVQAQPALVYTPVEHAHALEFERISEMLVQPAWPVSAGSADTSNCCNTPARRSRTSRYPDLRP